MSTTKTATLTAGSSPLAGRSNKSPPKSSKSVILKLPPSVLGRFPGLPASDSQTEIKTRPASASPDPSSAASNTAAAGAAAATTADTSTATAPTAPTSSGDNASDGASTPAAAPAPGATTLSGLSDASKRKGVPGPKPGNNKRGLGQGVETTPRPRGKPGPKKKARLDDGATEGQTRTTTGGGGSHKLGPKANQGAINAGLRALDRTGKPCRKWERKPFQLKSFTGVHWGIPTWRAPRTKVVEELSAEATENGVPNGDTGSKANNSTSAVESEKSNSGDGDATPVNTNAASSPAPAAAVAA